METQEQIHYNPFDPAADEPVELIWPHGYLARDDAPKLVYLDLNHWVGLAKANVGHPNSGAYVDLLPVARRAKTTGAVSFVLTSSLYMEIAKITDAHRRTDLATIIEELSDFRTLTSRDVVMTCEVTTVIDAVDGSTASGEPLRLVGTGVLHSVGRDGRLRVRDLTGSDITEVVREQSGDPEGFDAMLRDAHRELDRRVLTGPADAAEEARLRADGWLPDAAVTVAETRAQRERELVDILNADPRWRLGRLRDVVTAREAAHELLEIVTNMTYARSPDGSLFTELFASREASRCTARSMPSVAVVIELKTQYHRNAQLTWNTNTIFDIDALSIAVPYCDAVVTEKHAAHSLRRVHLDEAMNTAILRSPDQLTEWLST